MPITSARVPITDHAAAGFAWEIVVLDAPTGSGTPDNVSNLCDNPELAATSQGWGSVGGGGVRAGVSDHIATAFGWDLTVQEDTTPPPPVGTLLTGWTGDTDIPGVPRQILGTFGNRTTWDEVANLRYLSDAGSRPRVYLQGNPNGALDLGTPMIPTDGPGGSSNWNNLLDEAASGSHDADYTTLGTKLAQLNCRLIYCRLFWEFDIIPSAVNPTKFKTAWNRAVPLIRSGFASAAAAGQVLKIVWCPLADRTDWEDYWPDSNKVDIVATDPYGLMYQTTNPTVPTLIATVSQRLSAIAAFARNKGKNLGAGEWANFAPVSGTALTNRGCGDCPEYIDLVFDWARDNPVEYMVYFNLSGGGVGQTINQTPNSLARYQARVNGTGGGGGGGGGGGNTSFPSGSGPGELGPRVGARTFFDDFLGSSVDTSLWGIYNGPQQSTGEIWRPENLTVAGSICTVWGRPDGSQGGMAVDQGRNTRETGVWQQRSRLVGSSDHGHNPVPLLWPDSERGPGYGEMDWPETYFNGPWPPATGGYSEVFLHYGQGSNLQVGTRHFFNQSDWHTYTIEIRRNPARIRCWLDNTVVFETTNSQVLPSDRFVHQTLQINNLFIGAPRSAPTLQLQVDWVAHFQLGE